MASGLSLAGGALNALSIVESSRNKSDQYWAYMQANQYNAAVLRQRAELSGASSNEQEEQQRRMSRVALGEQRAQAAQSGTGFTGSNQDVTHQNMVMAELDALNIRYEGQLYKADLLTQAKQQDDQATLNMNNSKSATKQGFLGGVGALLGGGSSGGYGS